MKVFPPRSGGEGGLDGCGRSRLQVRGLALSPHWLADPHGDGRQAPHPQFSASAPPGSVGPGPHAEGAWPPRAWHPGGGHLRPHVGPGFAGLGEGVSRVPATRQGGALEKSWGPLAREDPRRCAPAWSPGRDQLATLTPQPGSPRSGRQGCPASWPLRHTRRRRVVLGHTLNKL
ncbi:hypothetical protein HJG60_011603 [Phyllostomus discolor]|uniref:Uncharacterized protein n=1 Tax=Phyllostomus discolor TaxID=89673 RepID=A0A833ZVL0_9CHIR|nr:hypothetical protein HJG60_011603 [Phyllostomus discolor]